MGGGQAKTAVQQTQGAEIVRSGKASPMSGAWSGSFPGKDLPRAVVLPSGRTRAQVLVFLLGPGLSRLQKLLS